MKDSARTNGVQGDGPDDIGRITGVSWRNIAITLIFRSVSNASDVS
jgi:hypothetical protein